MRYLNFVSKAAAALLQAILHVILSVVGAFCRLLGIAPPAMPMLPQPSTTPEDVRDEYREAIAAETADNRYANDLGKAVHRYASAGDPDIRSAVDLSALSPAQMDWLLGLGDEDLKRLATAGPKACELAVLGKRSGVVGLAAPAATAPEIEGPHSVRNLLVDRIRAAQAARTKLAS
ncbi:hypothetical protein [Pseudaminobacter sp. NGMCC 1.201702]|uniref:hypothetical protein n=1 Tax=Pseudaminobacter sp. NGMCC 1.201702 TaxID=3391825 RepID=UPI0039EDF378